MSQPISGTILTLTTATVKYNLLTLLNARQVALNTPVSDGYASEVNIYNNNAFGGATVYVGGADLNSTTNNGFPLLPTLAAGGQGAAYRFGPYDEKTIALGNIYLQGSADGATVAILIASN